MLRLLTRSSLLLLTLLFSAICIRAEILIIHNDENGIALIIGIDHFPHCPSADLHGCVNDAHLIAEALGARHVSHVVLLTDAQATKEGIHNALRRLARADGSVVPKSQDFVLYFSTNCCTQAKGEPALLTYSSKTETGKYDLHASELSGWLAPLHFRSTSLIIDTCYSGNFIDALRRGQTLQHQSTSTICCFSSCRRNEAAGGEVFNAVPHGFFSFFLADELTHNAALKFGELAASVSTRVKEWSHDTQHPQLTPGCEQYPLFGHPVPAIEQQQWNWYHARQDHPEKLTLAETPKCLHAHGPVDSYKCVITVGKQARYLLVLTNDTRGFYEVLYPTRDDQQIPYYDDAVLVQAGQKVEVIDLPGRESIKAILFADRQSALDAYKLFTSNEVEGMTQYASAHGAVPPGMLATAEADYKFVASSDYESKMR